MIHSQLSLHLPLSTLRQSNSGTKKPHRSFSKRLAVCASHPVDPFVTGYHNEPMHAKSLIVFPTIVNDDGDLWYDEGTG